jgi:hypothetical protein
VPPLPIGNEKLVNPLIGWLAIDLAPVTAALYPAVLNSLLTAAMLRFLALLYVLMA